MIWKGLICLFVLLLSVTTAYGQALVRSGEHDNFSRLVVYVPVTQEWTLEESDSGYRLILDGWSTGFDITSIYERMPRTRISSVLADNSQLEILTGCNCIATGSIVEGVGLIIDVSNVTSQVIDAVSEAVSEATEESVIELPALNRLPNLNLTEAGSADVTNPELDAFRKSLFEGLGRSASLSLIDLTEKDSDNDFTGSSADTTLAQVTEDGRVRVSTAIEEALNSQSDLVQPSSALECPVSRKYEIHDWGNETDFSAQISMVRGSIVDEFDVADPVDVRKLARLYLYFGMGAEARSVLAIFDLPEEEKEIIYSIADILEPRVASSSESLEGATGCEGAVVPWALLVRQPTDKISEAEAKDTVAQFLKWPRHLQRLVGSKLMEALSDANRHESVEILENTLKRQGESLPNDIEIGTVKRQNDPGQSLDDLLRIVQSGGDGAAEALGLYLELSLANRSAIDADLVELAEAFSRETKGTDISALLMNRRVEALAFLTGTSDALSALNQARTVGLKLEVGLGNRLSEHILERGKTSDIASFAMYLTESSPGISISISNSQKLSQALLDNGLPELAGKLYRRDDESDKTSNRLDADIAIANGDFISADAILQKLDGNEAIQRRIDILLRNGSAAEAWSQFGSKISGEELTRLAWFAKQWREVAPTTNEGNVASLLTRRLSSDPEEAPIATAREVSRNSEETRSAVMDLLQ